ncbi:hypothetical protein FRC18_003415 [Serendipita sp. 400]|nr:hypothetical protein FRC18_003415 [Serendipita sp. 400]
MPHTGYIAHLLMSECEERDGIPDANDTTEASQTCSVSVVRLSRRPPHDTLMRTRKAWMACFPILASTGSAITCAYFHDWYCFSMILLGMLASGVACFAAGRGTLDFKQPKPSPVSPRGDGVLYSGDKFVVVIGAEEAVCAVTRGGFFLDYGHRPQHHRMGFSSLLLTIQFLLQLLLIPQGTLFGQVMFLATFVCSWMYNCYLSSIDKEEVQRSILKSKILKIEDPDVRRYTFAKRTAAVVFLLLVLQSHDKEVILNELLPNNTDIWKTWKGNVLQQLREREESESLSNNGSNGEDGNLLNDLRGYAQTALTTYGTYKGAAHAPSVRQVATVEPSDRQVVTGDSSDHQVAFVDSSGHQEAIPLMPRTANMNEGNSNNV